MRQRQARVASLRAAAGLSEEQEAEEQTADDVGAVTSGGQQALSLPMSCNLPLSSFEREIDSCLLRAAERPKKKKSS